MIIRTLSNDETIIDCACSLSVCQLNKKIEQVMGIPIEEQCLAEDGDLFLSDKTFEYDSILTLFPPIRVKLKLVSNTLVDMIIFLPWSIRQLRVKIEQTLGIRYLHYNCCATAKNYNLTSSYQITINLLKTIPSLSSSQNMGYF
jgi:hypothetical protein